MKPKHIISGILLFVVSVFALNCFTIVSTGSEASVESFGEVHEKKILTGFNFVMPWWGIDEYSTLLETNSYDDLGIASQDKFKTNMDVAFTGAFLYGYADKTRGTTGTSGKFLEVHVYKRVLSCLTKAGGTVKNSQAFFEESVQIDMGRRTLSCVNDYLKEVGGQYQLTSVQFSDIRLDPTVKKFMVQTKKRQEEENQAESSLQIAETLAQKIVKTSEAKLLAAENDKEARKLAADALYYEKQQEAKGNKELAKSLSKELVDYTKANRWNGKLPHVQAGSSADFLIDTRN